MGIRVLYPADSSLPLGVEVPVVAASPTRRSASPGQAPGL